MPLDRDSVAWLENRARPVTTSMEQIDAALARARQAEKERQRQAALERLRERDRNRKRRVANVLAEMKERNRSMASR